MTDWQRCDRPVVYEIRVQGILDADLWADWFGGFAIVPQENGETLLTGPIADQAALHGILDTIHGLNLSLISVCRAGQKRI